MLLPHDATHERQLVDKIGAPLDMLSELRRAVEHNELRLYLQPKVALHGQPGLAAEALVRWQHPQRGLVPPVNFIPFAEQTGFVRQLTLWVFEEVARLLASPQARHLPLRVSVNLSTRDLLDRMASLKYEPDTPENDSMVNELADATVQLINDIEADAHRTKEETDLVVKKSSSRFNQR